MIRRRIRLGLLGGVAMSPDFMEGFRISLHAALETEGYRMRSQLVYPYGVWSRSLALQVAEAGHDLWLGFRAYARSIGGRRALDALNTPAFGSGNAPSRWAKKVERSATLDQGRVEKTADSMDELTVLVGHSAGGIAALHAAEALNAAAGTDPLCLVVMIGSPRIRVPAHLRGSVLYLYAAAGLKPAPGVIARSADPICRIGSFGGWTTAGTGHGKESGKPDANGAEALAGKENGTDNRAGTGEGSQVGSGKYRLPFWRSMRHSPEHVAALTVIGGHADYFRERAPHVHPTGESNLQLTQEAVLKWLRPRLGS